MKAAKTILGIVLCLFLVGVAFELLPFVFAAIWQLLFFLIPVAFVGAIIFAIMWYRQAKEIERSRPRSRKELDSARRTVMAVVGELKPQIPIGTKMCVLR